MPRPFQPRHPAIEPIALFARLLFAFVLFCALLLVSHGATLLIDTPMGAVIMPPSEINSVTLTDTGSATSLNIGPLSASTFTLTGTGTSSLYPATGGATGNLTFAGQLIKDGSGRWVITRTFGPFAGIDVQAGTLQLGEYGGGGAPRTINLSNIAGPITLAAGSILEFQNSLTGSLSSAISGAGSLLLQSDTATSAQSTFRSTGAWTHTGGTSLSARAVLYLDAGSSIAGDISNTGTLVFENGDYLYGGNLTGTGGIIKRGTGKLTLERPVQETGGITISAGSLQIGTGGNASLAASQVVFSAGTRLIFNGSNNVNYSGSLLTGTGIIEQAGTGSLTLSGTNNGNSVAISAGTLFLSSSVNKLVEASGGTIKTLGSTAITSSTPLSLTGPLNIDINGTQPALTISGRISGNGSLTKLGSGMLDGRLTLSGNNTTWTGGLNIAGGEVRLQNSNAAGTGDIRVIGPSRLTLGSALVIPNNIIVDPLASLSIVSPGTLSGNLSGGPITVSSGTLTTTGTVAGSLLTIDSGSLTSAGTINSDIVINGGLTALTFSRAGDYSFGYNISGTGQFIKSGTGTLSLNGVNTYAGATSLNAGGLVVNTSSLPGNITMQSNTNLIFDQDFDGTYSGTITTAGTGSHAVRKTGTGTLYRDMTLGAGLFIDEGEVNFVPVSAIRFLSGSVAVASGARLGFSTAGYVQYDGAISGSGEIHNRGVGRTHFTDISGFTGDMFIERGTVIIDEAGLNAGNVVNNGSLDLLNGGFVSSNISGSGAVSFYQTSILTGTNSFTGGSTINAIAEVWVGNGGTTGSLAGDVFINPSGTLRSWRSDDSQMDGDIYGGGLLLKDGLSTLSLLGDVNTAVRINEGTLSVGNGGTIGSLAGNIENNSALVFNRSDDVTFSGTITGTGSVSQNGSGTLTILGSQSNSGLTSANAGRLFVLGSLAGDTLVRNGATLGGTGSVAGGVTLESGGRITPGFSPGTLTVGSLLLNSGSILDFELGTPGVVGGPTNDLIISNGDVVLDGLLNVFDSGGFTFGTYRLINYAGTLTDNILDINSVPAGFSLSDFSVQTAITGQVNLVVSGGPSGPFEFWNGSTTTPGAIVGGSGTWNNTPQTNWINSDATASGPWTPGNAIFAGSAGIATLGDNISFSNIQFATSGYVINSGAYSLTPMLAASEIRVDSGNATIAARLTGAGGINKTGSGTLILDADNDFSGGTTIASGTLQVGNGGTAGALSGNVLNNGVFAWNKSSLDVFAGVVSGSGSLTKTGSGILNLTGNNTYAGGTTISSGGLIVGDGATSGLIVGDVANSGTFTWNRGSADTFSGLISGSGIVEKRGSGTLTLTAQNTYTGDTYINGGILRAGVAGNPFGVNSIINFAGSGESMELNDFNVAVGGLSGGSDANIRLGSGTLTLGYSGPLSYGFDGVISGSGGLVKQGSALQILAGNNTFTGPVSINGGILHAASQSALGDNTSVSLADNAGAILRVGNAFGDGSRIGSLEGGGLTGGNVELQAWNTLTTGGNNRSTAYAGVISGGGRFAKTGSGTLTLSGINTFTGGTTIDAGSLIITGAVGNVAVSSGGLLGGTGTTGDVVASDGGIINPGLPGLAGTLTTGSLTLSPSSILSYNLSTPGIIGSGVNDLLTVGGDLLLDGFLDINNLGGFGYGSYRLIDYSGFLTDDGLSLGLIPPGFESSVFEIQTAIGGQVNLIVSAPLPGGPFNFWNGSTLTPTGTIEGGSGTWNNVVTNTNWSNASATNSGAWVPQFAIFTAAPGTVSLGEDVAATGMQFAVDGYVINGGGYGITLTDPASTVRVDTGTATINAPLSGAGNLVKTGTGTLILGGDTAFSSNTLSAGTLQIGNGATGGTLAGGTAISSAATLAFNRSDSTTYSGSTSGAGSLEQRGSGTLVLLGSNAHSGGTTISSGTLQVGNGGTAGALSGNVLNNGVFAWNKSSADTFAGSVSGAGSFVKSGTGTLGITGPLSHSGGTSINAGRLDLLDGGSLAGNVVIAGGAVLGVNKAGNLTLPGVISGNGSFVKDGVGTTILAGANSYTGGTTINAGVLQGTTASLQGSIQNFAVLRFGQETDGNFVGSISGSGSVQKTGAGTLGLSGNHPYTGTTDLIGGAIRLDNATLGTSQFNVGVGTTLSGTGAIAGNLVNGGTVFPSRIGGLSIGGDFTQLATGVLIVEVASATSFSKLDITGSATLDGVVRVVRLDSYNPRSGDKLKFLTAAGGVNGRFATFEQNSSVFSLEYGADYVALSVGGGPGPDPGPDPIQAMPVETAEIAKQAVGESIAWVGLSVKEIAFSDTQTLAATLGNRFSVIRAGQARGWQAYGIPSALAAESNMHIPEDYSLWASAAGVFSSVKSVADIPKFNYTTGSVLVGADKQYANGFSAGIYAGFSETNSKQDAGSVAVNTARAGIYGSYQNGAAWASASLGGTGSSYNLRRKDPLNELTGSGSPNSWGLESTLSGGYDFRRGALTITPFASAQLSLLSVDGYTETGAGSMNARVGSQTAASLRGTLGLSASYDIQLSRDVVLTPTASVYYQREFLDNGYSVPVALSSGSGTSLNADIGAGGRNIVGASIGASVRYKDRLSGFVSVGAQTSDTQTSGTVMAGLGISF